ncbi:hypothetical protein BDW02DRAFT_577371 [Decorospora gaudefroyi]|uniref:F-box domain-containing protein n=1 Tax=Decorospora gaudefroyi TaxID=184978 RepID=A0A6A5KPS4_9PLEO|nr:hypothetical protein BDW02DRAFT_577371 [Decorospora gaudefroyi]
MGAFDCYCVLCSGPLHIGVVEFGSRKGKSMRRRRQLVKEEKRKIARGCTRKSDVDDGDGDTSDDDEEMEDVPDFVALEQQRIEQQEQDEDDADSDYEYSSATSSEDTESVNSRDSDLHTEWIPDVNIRPRSPEPEPEPEVFSDNWSQASELPMTQRWGNKSDEDDSDVHDYDPGLFREMDTKWITRCRALGLNSDAPGGPKAFISGRGYYDEYGYFEVVKPGRDPNDTGESSLCCTSYDEERNIAYLFHEACFEILAKSLGHANGKDVNKDVMYRVMETYREDDRASLNVNYGLRAECGQFWECLPGEEYSVCDPSHHAGLEEELQGMLPASLFGKTLGSIDLLHKVHNDPFNVLPYDVLLGIFERVDTKGMLSLMKASYHVNNSTREPAFWSHMTRLRIFPWFYELRSFAQTAVLEALDYKGLFLWVDAVTRPEFGNQGPLMGIANRRRIWGISQMLVPLYKEKVGPVPQPEPENSQEAQAILSSAVCLHMPMTMYPQPEEPRTISTQFVRAWNDIGYRSCDLDTYWRKTERSHFPVLVGIAVKFGEQQRLFGSSEGQLSSPMHIEAGEWIKEVVCYVKEVGIFGVGLGHDSGIFCIRVTLTSGRSKRIAINQRDGTAMRPFVVLDGMHLVGLTGQVAPDGVISRLGLLQAARPGFAPSVRPEYTSAHQMLWKNYAASRYQEPIWAHGVYVHDWFPPSAHAPSFNLPADMTPNELFLWAKDAKCLKDVTPIECFQPVGGWSRSLPVRSAKPSQAESPTQGETTTVPILGSFPGLRTDNNEICSQTRSAPSIVGIRPGSHNFMGGRGHTIGSGGPVASQHSDWHLGTKGEGSLMRELRQTRDKDKSGNSQFHPDATKIFNIDAKAGEVITEVHVQREYRALRLVTTFGREGHFGEEKEWGQEEWWCRKAGEGEVFLGISAGFGEMAGWSESRNTWSHYKLSRVGVVFVRVGEEGKVVKVSAPKIKTPQTAACTPVATFHSMKPGVAGDYGMTAAFLRTNGARKHVGKRV